MSEPPKNRGNGGVVLILVLFLTMTGCISQQFQDADDFNKQTDCLRVMAQFGLTADC